MANLLIEDKRIVLSIVLENYFGDEDLKDYLSEHLPDARCDFVVGSGGPNGSFDEYAIYRRR